MTAAPLAFEKSSSSRAQLEADTSSFDQAASPAVGFHPETPAACSQPRLFVSTPLRWHRAVPEQRCAEMLPTPSLTPLCKRHISLRNYLESSAKLRSQALKNLNLYY